MEEDPSFEEEMEEYRREPASVFATEVPVESLTVSKSTKAGGGRPDLRSSLGNNESTLTFVKGACQKMATKYCGIVDLVMRPSYLQSYIKAQIVVRVYAAVKI